ncbi:uncharacterized protein LOC117107852 [Anneissia japonica]|uniref:uncharacterized protein LOC117107852 n=1 Tax=Anneissia japonica TaxID=1529436 RepID=UPI0014258FBA|nr:uncharacterized protein LOC117107852 [Anneissia japonica]
MELLLIFFSISVINNCVFSQEYEDDSKYNPPQVNGCQYRKAFYTPRQNVHRLESCLDDCRCDLNEQRQYEIICQNQRVCPFEDSRCEEATIDECGCRSCKIEYDSYVIFKTKDDYKYVFYPVPLNTEGGILLNLKVTTNRDAYIGLSPQPMDSKPMYEIGVGIHGNRVSVIRRCKQCNSEKMRVTKGVLKNKVTELWLSFVDGKLSVGESGQPSFISFTDPNPIDVRYLAMATGYGSKGLWEIAELDYKATSSKHILTGCSEQIDVTSAWQQIETNSAHRFGFEVESTGDFLLRLSSSDQDTNTKFYYEVTIVEKRNQLSKIRKCKYDGCDVEGAIAKTNYLNMESAQRFWVIFSPNGLIEVGLEGYAPFLTWMDIDYVPVSTLEVSTGGSATARFSYCQLEFRDYKISEFTAYVSLTTNTDDYVYIDNKLVSERLEFYIKASSDVVLVLSPKKDDVEVYRIIIAYGANGESTLSHCHSKYDCVIKESTTTHDILSATTPRGFWIIFDRSGRVEVGEEDKSPFLTWQDPYPLAVNYLAYATTEGGYAAIDFSVNEQPRASYQIGEFLAPFDVITRRNDFVYLDYSFGSDRRLEFYVTADSDVYLSLSPFKNDTEFYQIIIATGAKGVSTLSHCFDKDDCHVKASTITKNFLPGNSRGFWVTFDPSGQVDVGRDGYSPFLSWEDPYPLPVNYLGYATVPGGKVEIQFDLKEEKSTKYIIKEFRNPLSFISTSDNYEYLDYKLKSRTVEFFVKATNDISIALGPNRDDVEFYRITVAYGLAANSTLSHCFDKDTCHIKAWAITDDFLTDTEYQGFWIKFNPSGKVDVGRDGYTAFMSWEDPYPLPTNFIGYASVEGSRLEIQFEKRDFIASDCIGVTKIATIRNLLYLDTTINSNSIRFFATGRGDVMISIGPYNNDTEFYLIIIAHGAYSTSTLSHCFTADDCHIKASVTSNNVFEADKRTGFLIEFNPDGKVDVFRAGHSEPFLYWEDPYPLPINYIGYAVQNGVAMTYEFCLNDSEY